MFRPCYAVQLYSAVIIVLHFSYITSSCKRKKAT